MTAAAATAPLVIVDRAAIRRQRILGIAYLVMGAVVAYFLTSNMKVDATSTFVLKPAGSHGGLDIPSLVVPSMLTVYLAAAICAGFGAIQLIRGFGTRWSVVLGVVAVAFVFAFLTWAAAGKSAEEILADLEAAVRQFRENVAARFGGKGEW